MEWVDIAVIMTGIGSIFAIIVSLIAIRKNQEANEINVVRQNNSEFIDSLFELKRAYDSELALSLPFRIDNVMNSFLQNNTDQIKIFNDFKIFICDLLRDAKIPYMKIISDINALASSRNNVYVQKCGQIIDDFHLANNAFYRESEEFLDALIETWIAKGNFLSLNKNAEALVDKLCDLVYKEKVYSEFIGAFSTELRKQTETPKYFSFNKTFGNVPIFENAYGNLAHYGFVDNDKGEIKSKQLTETKERIDNIKETRMDNFLASLKVYKYKLENKPKKA